MVWAQLANRKGLYQSPQTAILDREESKFESSSQSGAFPVQSLYYKRRSAVQMIIQPLIKPALPPDGTPYVRHPSLRIIDYIDTL